MPNLYCQHGIRGLAAAAFLEEQGLTGVKSLAGGI
jgi:rhodanese-related sulfurtransferase